MDDIPVKTVSQRPKPIRRILDVYIYPYFDLGDKVGTIEIDLLSPLPLYVGCAMRPYGSKKLLVRRKGDR